MKHWLAGSADGMFATATLRGHLLRGGVALALLYFAVSHQHGQPLAAMAAGLLALVAMRGCPVCWTIGLVETLRASWRARRSR